MMVDDQETTPTTVRTTMTSSSMQSFPSSPSFANAENKAKFHIDDDDMDGDMVANAEQRHYQHHHHHGVQECSQSHLAKKDPHTFDEEESTGDDDGDSLSWHSSCNANGHQHSSPNHVKQQAAKQERSRLGKNESRAILCLRIFVIGLLLVLAASTASAIYLTVQDTETTAFETNFEFYSKIVRERFNTAIERKLNAVDSLSVIITSHANNEGGEDNVGGNPINNIIGNGTTTTTTSEGSQFPFVTVPDFEYKGSNARITGDTVMSFYLPYVTYDNRDAWESYSQEHGMHLLKGWKEEQYQKFAQDTKYGMEFGTKNDLNGIGGEALESGSLSDENRRPPSHIWMADDEDNNDGSSATERDESVSPPTTPLLISPVFP